MQGGGGGGGGGGSNYDINMLLEEARTRWLNPDEVLFIIQNYNQLGYLEITQSPEQIPYYGCLFYFDKQKFDYLFDDDNAHIWRHYTYGRAEDTSIERLMAGGSETILCLYAHLRQNPNYQRRCYKIQSRAFKYIYLIHCREVMVTGVGGGGGGGGFERNRITIEQIWPPFSYVNAANNHRKVILRGGSFRYEYPTVELFCAFGNKRVPFYLVDNGIAICKVPASRRPRKVPLFITYGDGEPCSDVHEFAYHPTPDNYLEAYPNAEQDIKNIISIC